MKDLDDPHRPWCGTCGHDIEFITTPDGADPVWAPPYWRHLIPPINPHPAYRAVVVVDHSIRVEQLDGGPIRVGCACGRWGGTAPSMDAAVDGWKRHRSDVLCLVRDGDEPDAPTCNLDRGHGQGSKVHQEWRQGKLWAEWGSEDDQLG